MNTKSIPALVSAALLSACATAPTSQPQSQPAPTAVAPEPSSLTRVYFYAQRGQSPEQQDRDRYECFNWAAQQTGFDPSRRPAPSGNARLVPVHPSGETVAAGALMGAAIGAVVSKPWNRGEGAIVGAVAGSALGAVAASSQEAAARNAQKQTPARSSYEQQAAEYRRAMSACLEGRGYVVK